MLAQRLSLIFNTMDIQNIFRGTSMIKGSLKFFDHGDNRVPTATPSNRITFCHILPSNLVSSRRLLSTTHSLMGVIPEGRNPNQSYPTPSRAGRLWWWLAAAHDGGRCCGELACDMVDDLELGGAAMEAAALAWRHRCRGGGGSGVNNMDGVPIPESMEGDTRRYRRKSRPFEGPTSMAPVGVAPLLGGITEVCWHLSRSHLGLVVVSGQMNCTSG
jgi:hypothetical protein